MTRNPPALIAVLITLLCVGAASAQPTSPIRGGDLPQPLPLFPSDNWWNVDLTNAPVDPQSAAFIDFIGAIPVLHPDFGGDNDDPAAPIFGMPYIVVGGDQALVPVVFDTDDESDAGAPGRPGYPIPEEAKTQQKWIEGGLAGGDQDADGDRHMLLVDRDHRILYELYFTRWNAAAGRWEAGSGAVFLLDSNARRPDMWTSADAAGLAILPGLVRYDEASSGVPIRHAFRVTVRRTNHYVYPASHEAGMMPGALPMGARLRLKATVDLSRFPEAARTILQAMKTYGLIVADNGSDLFVTGTYDPRWDIDLLRPAFDSIKATDFEVIQLGWIPPARTRHRAARHL